MIAHSSCEKVAHNLTEIAGILTGFLVVMMLVIDGIAKRHAQISPMLANFDETKTKKEPVKPISST